jgi:hypothetical protein
MGRIGLLTKSSTLSPLDLKYKLFIGCLKALHAHYLHVERSHVLPKYKSKACLDEYSDVLHGTDLIDVFDNRHIQGDNIVLMFSIDGAQLYAKKASACWIYIWVLFNLLPSM